MDRELLSHFVYGGIIGAFDIQIAIKYGFYIYMYIHTYITYIYPFVSINYQNVKIKMTFQLCNWTLSHWRMCRYEGKRTAWGPLSFESWCKRRMLKGGSSELWILSGMRQQRSQEEKNSLRKRCLSILEYEKLEDWCLVTSFVNKKWEVSLIEGFLMA